MLSSGTDGAGAELEKIEEKTDAAGSCRIAGSAVDSLIFKSTEGTDLGTRTAAAFFFCSAFLFAATRVSSPANF